MYKYESFVCNKLKNIKKNKTIQFLLHPIILTLFTPTLIVLCKDGNIFLYH
jgi:hypothetical protein